MKLLSIAGDFPGWTYISEITGEMVPVSKRFAVQHPEIAEQLTPLEPILVKKYPHLDFDFCFCFRCLSRESGWVSKARLYKNGPDSFNVRNHIPEESRTLGMDIVVYVEDFMSIKKDRNAQKIILGKELLRFLKLTLPKYTKKIPMTKEEVSDILVIIETWLIDHHWIDQA